MINPPIDKLIKKAPCRYALVVGVAKRAKELETKENEKEYIGDKVNDKKEGFGMMIYDNGDKSTGKKSIQEAAEEIYNGSYVVKVNPVE